MHPSAGEPIRLRLPVALTVVEEHVGADVGRCRFGTCRVGARKHIRGIPCGALRPAEILQCFFGRERTLMGDSHQSVGILARTSTRPEVSRLATTRRCWRSAPASGRCGWSGRATSLCCRPASDRERGARSSVHHRRLLAGGRHPRLVISCGFRSPRPGGRWVEARKVAKQRLAQGRRWDLYTLSEQAARGQG